jgi:hypothetical protein
MARNAHIQESMNTTTKTNWIQVGTRVYDSLGTEIAGEVEYVTEDGWVGVRDAEGRLDELPSDRAVSQANQ